MCGIFGVWNFNGIKGHHLKKASEILAHRGPDDEGFLVVGEKLNSFSGDDSSIKDNPIPHDLNTSNAFLHRRLSILDLSPAGHQPMQLGSRGLSIVFNGEIYNFRDLISQYNLKVETGTDTEVILKLYAKIGVEAFSKFRGMWALALYDQKKNELVLSRDRFGIKPLFLVENGKSLAFSSEIKPLLFLPGIEAQWGIDDILQFITFGATSNPHESFFKGINSLEPGTTRIYDTDSLESKTHRYYDLSQKLGRSEFQDGSFSERFSESIHEHLIADVEVGSCLSGGLDSSLIVAESARSVAGNFQTFTCSFPNDTIDETAFAKQLGDKFQNVNQKFITPTSDDFLQTWDKLILAQERPFGSASIFAQYTVMKLASDNGVKVLLDGQGADEVLGGYYPFAGAYLLSLLKAGKFIEFQRNLKALKTNFNPRMGQAMLRSLYYDLPAFLQKKARQNQRLGYRLIAPEYLPRVEGLESPDRGATDFTDLTLKSIEFGLYELLQYEDRNAMQFSIETRVPFLDHRLVEWALNQPAGEKMKGGWTKFPIRRSLDIAGLNKLAWRKDKLGFVAPQDRWLMELKAELKTRFETSELQAVFNREALLQLVDSHLSNNSNLSEFWRIFALVRWLELFKIKLV